jgi:hypothetical protein
LGRGEEIKERDHNESTALLAIRPTANADNSNRITRKEKYGWFDERFSNKVSIKMVTLLLLRYGACSSGAGPDG